MNNNSKNSNNKNTEPKKRMFAPAAKEAFILNIPNSFHSKDWTDRFEIPVYGSPRDKLGSLLTNKTLIINATRMSAIENPIVDNDSAFYGLFKKYELTPEEILLQIPDGEFLSQRYDLAFWISLIRKLPDLEYDKIICTCQGGFGRTGTLLASLHIARRFYDCLYKEQEKITISPMAVIEYIRKIYYPEAVETMDQALYIKMLCETPLTRELL